MAQTTGNTSECSGCVEAAVGTSPADIDEDGDVGLDYHALLWPCMESLGAEIEVQCVDADCTGDGIIDLSDWLMLQGALWEQHNPTTTPVAWCLAGASENTRGAGFQPAFRAALRRPPSGTG